MTTMNKLSKKIHWDTRILNWMTRELPITADVEEEDSEENDINGQSILVIS